MGVPEFFADQLRSPSGWFGRTVMSRFFARSSAAINKLTMTSLMLEPEDSVLEIGFGAGDLIAHMAPAVCSGFIAGADSSPDMVAVSASRLAPLVRAGLVELRCASVENLPYADGRFTKACTVNTVYFWPDPDAALNELSRVLRPGGTLVIGFSPAEAMRKMPKRLTGHGFTLYEPVRLQSALEDAGFRDVSMVPGRGPRGDFFCAVATKSGTSGEPRGAEC